MYCAVCVTLVTLHTAVVRKYSSYLLHNYVHRYLYLFDHIINHHTAAGID